MPVSNKSTQPRAMLFRDRGWVLGFVLYARVRTPTHEGVVWRRQRCCMVVKEPQGKQDRVAGLSCTRKHSRKDLCS